MKYDVRKNCHITEIKNILSTTDYDRLPEVLDGFRADERSGVIKLIKQFENKYSAFSRAEKT